MKFDEFYISNHEGKSNCVIRTFCKMFGDEYNNVYNDLCSIAQRIGGNSFNDIETFETYMKEHNTHKIDYGNDIKIKDLDLDNGSYAVFCWDKKDYYHMVTIIDNVLYDKNSESLELYTITVYKLDVN